MGPFNSHLPTSFPPWAGILVGIVLSAGVWQLGDLTARGCFGLRHPLFGILFGGLVCAFLAYFLAVTPGTFPFFIPLGSLLLLAGIWALGSQVPFWLRGAVEWKRRDPVALGLIALWGLVSLAPVTSADDLDYHMGVPVYILRHHAWPPPELWMTSNLAGWGEAFNALGLGLGTENAGQILQFLALVFFWHHLTQGLGRETTRLAGLVIFGCPVLLQLMTSAKPQIFPQVTTATALLLALRELPTNRRALSAVAVLLAGASQYKLSFFLTGFPIAVLALVKAGWPGIRAAWPGVMAGCTLLAPKTLWNLQHAQEPGWQSLLSTAPPEFLQWLARYRENPFPWPLDVLIPGSLGNISTVVGLGWLATAAMFPLNQASRQFLPCLVAGLGLTSWLGQPVGRAYYEFLLWIAAGLAARWGSKDPEPIFTKGFRPILQVQTLAVAALAFWGVWSLSRALLGRAEREEVLAQCGYEYSGMAWANRVLPSESVFLTGFRSCAYLQGDFLPMHWLSLPSSPARRAGFLEQIQRRTPRFLLTSGPGMPEEIARAVGKKLQESPEFSQASRNPWNRGGAYRLAVYEFDPEALGGQGSRGNPTSATSP